MTAKEKIAELRRIMKDHNIDACLIPMTDPHQSEYISTQWKVLEWYSGFTGSAGNFIVTSEFAGLWTDSRYFLQAETQLADSGIQLMKLKTAHASEYVQWLEDSLPPGSVVGADFKLIAMRLHNSMKKALSEKNIQLTDSDIALRIWKNRPESPLWPVFEHETKYAGRSRKEKLDLIRKKMKEQGADYHLLGALDDIAWTFNLRGNDVAYNPVFLSYALIGKENTMLFVDKRKVSDDLNRELAEDSIKLMGYDTIDFVLSGLAPGSIVLLDPGKTSRWLFDQIPSGCQIKKDLTIPTLLKSIKNKVEIRHIRNVMVKDGVALVKFFMWLESEVPSGKITEMKLARKLNDFRAEQKDYFGESFSTIAGYKDHGAIVHYRATPETDYTLRSEGILLLDSGGQYLDGTTDITRTIALGEPTPEQKRSYSLVLKGHIALTTITFPEGTKGYQLEGMARRPLWESLLNFGHGTGHGVGFFLNVHEGPQSLGTGPTTHPGSGFKEGMLTSNEPGYYEAGSYGIRIENLILCVAAGESQSGKFLKFETVTLFPIATNLIDPDLINGREIKWLNNYHKKVFEYLSPHLDEREIKWLKNKTKPI